MNQQDLFPGFQFGIFLNRLGRSQGTDAVVEHDVAVGIVPVEHPLDTFQDHAAGIVVDRGQQHSIDGGGKPGDGITFAQVLLEDLQQAVHDLVLADIVNLLVVVGGDHDDGQEHGSAETFQVAHLQIEDFLEHGVLADEGAAAVAALPQFVADGFKVEVQGLAGRNDLLVELLQVLAGLYAQVPVVQLHHMLVLHQCFTGTVDLNQR